MYSFLIFFSSLKLTTKQASEIIRKTANSISKLLELIIDVVAQKGMYTSRKNNKNTIKRENKNKTSKNADL